MRNVAAHLWLVLLLCASGAAQGKGKKAEPDRREEATRLSQAGAAAVKAGKFTVALELLDQAYQLFPSPNLHYNLGLTLRGLHRNVEAATQMQLFLTEATGAASSVRVAAQTALEELEQEVAAMTLHGGAAGTAVIVDGARVGSAPLSTPLYLSPGRHVVTVDRVGRARFEKHFTAEAGEHIVVDADAPDSPGASLPAAPRARPWARRHVASLTLASVGVASLLVALGTGLTAKSKFDALASECDPGTHICPATENATRDSANRFAITADAFLAIGLVAVAGAGVAALLEWRATRKEARDAWTGLGAEGAF